MTKIALLMVAVLAVASLAQAGVIPDDVQAQLDLLDQGFKQAVASLEAKVAENPKLQGVLNEFKKIYNASIELIKKGVADGKIKAEEIEASPEYQEAKALIQKVLHKGQLGASSDEILDSVEKGLDITGKILNTIVPFASKLFG